MGKLTIKAEFIGARRAAQNYTQAASSLSGLLKETEGKVAGQAEVIFSAFAPVRSGVLARGIQAVSTGTGSIVKAVARNPIDGYDYVGVTRFGHKKGRITAKSDRKKASVIQTGQARRGRVGGKLRFPLGGQIMYRSSVRGFKPTGDWTQQALPAIKEAADREMENLGRGLVRSIA